MRGALVLTSATKETVWPCQPKTVTPTDLKSGRLRPPATQDSLIASDQSRAIAVVGVLGEELADPFPVHADDEVSLLQK